MSRGEALREVGVLSLELDGVKVTLAPSLPRQEVAAAFDEPQMHESADPMDNSATFGTNGRIPGFPRLHLGDG